MKKLFKYVIPCLAVTFMMTSCYSTMDDKASIDSPFAEVLKDADVIDHTLTDPTKEIKEKERSRYEKLCREFRLTEAAE